MSEIHKFLFEGLPVRGVLVQLTKAWAEILRRRADNTTHGAYLTPVQNLLGEMMAAAVLMQSNIRFDGSLIVQIFGDGPVKFAMAEVQTDFGMRATATVQTPVQMGDSFSQMVNVNNKGRCVITLDPHNRLPSQVPYQGYQGVVALYGDASEKLENLSDVLQHYMLQREQLDTTLVLAADDKVAAGLLIQRLPPNEAGNVTGAACEDAIGSCEDYKRISVLASSLKREELLTLDADTILRRLFWQEKLLWQNPLTAQTKPHFSCSCSREKVGKMLLGLGQNEVQDILKERGDIEVGCDLCGLQYRFDAVEAAQFCY